MLLMSQMYDICDIWLVLLTMKMQCLLTCNQAGFNNHNPC